MKRKLLLLLLVLMLAVSLISCVPTTPPDGECAHTDADPKDNICDICGDVLGECIVTPGEHTCYICGKVLSVCVDDNGDGKCDTCSASMCNCADRDPLDHKCDKCGTVLSVCKDEEPIDHLCDICGIKLSECYDIEAPYNECDLCGAVISECIDLSPEDHYCDVCGTKLSECYDTEAPYHECDLCGAVISVCNDEDPADHLCDICGKTVSECTDTKEPFHECDVCGSDLGGCIDVSPKDHYCDVCGVLLSYEVPALTKEPLDISSLPAYDENKYIVINGNNPEFTEYQLASGSYEYYGARDSLGRCTVAVALIGTDLMPTEGRGSISSVTPTGWHSSSIYERCHLIAFSLTGENANWDNLITGTYDLNEVMQSFEAMVCDYIKETSNHVLYRVTPYFEGNNLLASGVQMEAYSVEDEGDGICFNIYVYNAEVDYEIDYSNGDAKLSDESELNNCTFVINGRNGKFHLPTCSSVTDMSESNKIYSYDTYEYLVENGYSPCGNCLKNYTP